MGLRGIAPMELVLVLLIVLVLFGGKRLRSLGADLGGALRGFRSAVRDAPDEESGAPPAPAGTTDPLRPHAPADVARSR